MGMFDEMFPEYFQPGEEELTELWESATFVLDTNVLLNLYRYTVSTRDVLLEVLESLQNQLWIPHQVAEEFSRNRVRVIMEQTDIIAKYQSTLRKISEFITEELKSTSTQKDHPLINEELILKDFERVISDNEKLLKAASEKMISPTSDTIVLKRVEAMLEGKVGEAFSDKERELAIKEGEKRFEDKIPPGFGDASKEGDEKYGDWFLWRQTLDYAKANGKSVILITDDSRKNDWWWSERNKTVGPAFQLVKEMKLVTNTRFYMYRPVRFMEFAKNYLHSKINDEAIKEIREVGKQESDYAKSLYRSREIISYLLDHQSIDDPKLRELGKQLRELRDKGFSESLMRRMFELEMSKVKEQGMPEGEFMNKVDGKFLDSEMRYLVERGMQVSEINRMRDHGFSASEVRNMLEDGLSMDDLLAHGIPESDIRSMLSRESIRRSRKRKHDYEDGGE